LFGQIRTIQNDEIANYEGLSAVLRHRFSHGLQFLASYTWSQPGEGEHTRLPPVRARSHTGSAQRSCEYAGDPSERICETPRSLRTPSGWRRSPSASGLQRRAAAPLAGGWSAWWRASAAPACRRTAG